VPFDEESDELIALSNGIAEAGFGIVPATRNQFEWRTCFASAQRQQN
jgi:hypothetical protein